MRGERDDDHPAGNVPEDRGNAEFYIRCGAAGLCTVHGHDPDQAAGGGTGLPAVRPAGKECDPDAGGGKAVRLRGEDPAAGAGDPAGRAGSGRAFRPAPAGGFGIPLLQPAAGGADGIPAEISRGGHPAFVHHARHIPGPAEEGKPGYRLVPEPGHGLPGPGAAV